jgi:hypothetical protein
MLAARKGLAGDSLVWREIWGLAGDQGLWREISRHLAGGGNAALRQLAQQAYALRKRVSRDGTVHTARELGR